MNNQFPLLYRLRRVVLALWILAWMAAFTSTHIPGEDLPSIQVSDKLLHTVGFFGLGAGFMITLISYGVRRLNRIVLVVAVMMIYGALDEYTQQFFHRTTDIKDWCADMIGLAASVVAVELFFSLVRLLFPQPVTEEAVPRRSLPNGE
jgi:VanZ family protein